MVEETAPERAVKSTAAADGAAGNPKSAWKNRVAAIGQTLAKHWFVGLITLALAVHATGLWIFAVQRTAQPERTAEVDLGRYEFRNAAPRRGEVSEAAFALHIRFIDEVESRAHRQLADRRYRVEQDIEEILRQAHGVDFADPRLRELKRQLQEQINRSLELRSVADVIVTDLDIDSDHVAASPARPSHDEPGHDNPTPDGPEPAGGAQATNEGDWSDAPAS
jgi:flagellar basal body-associated protein FliL